MLKLAMYMLVLPIAIVIVLTIVMALHEDKSESSEGRCLDGRPLRTKDDWEQWWVWKGFADGLSAHLDELERKMLDDENTDSAATLEEWHRQYEKIRRIYIRHGMWNTHINSQAPFEPTAAQLRKEQALFAAMEKKQQAAVEKQQAAAEMRTIYEKYSESFFAYINQQPNHVALRASMIRAIAEEYETDSKFVWKMYRKMRNDNRIKEEQNEAGRWEVRKTFVRKPRPAPQKHRISQYSETLYRQVTHRTEYKALITVGAPVDLSREEGSCRFISQSSGREYITHLDRCSCPVYRKGAEPCKHMVALASRLGYYHIHVHASTP